jgi:hypothetical protein
MSKYIDPAVNEIYLNRMIESSNPLLFFELCEKLPHFEMQIHKLPTSTQCLVLTPGMLQIGFSIFVPLVR